jgi:hypothetical protein
MSAQSSNSRGAPHRCCGARCISMLALVLAIGLGSVGFGDSAASAKTLRPATKSKSPQIDTALSITAETAVEVDGIDRKRVDDAMALISLDWKHLYAGWTIRFRPARKGFLAVTLVQQKRVDVYVRKDRTSVGIAHDVAHELGHVTDVSFLDETNRLRFLEIRGLPAQTPWWTCNSCGDMQVGAGDFAESFAMLIAPKFKYYSELGTVPDNDQLVGMRAALPELVQAAFVTL